MQELLRYLEPISSNPSNFSHIPFFWYLSNRTCRYARTVFPVSGTLVDRQCAEQIRLADQEPIFLPPTGRPGPDLAANHRQQEQQRQMIFAKYSCGQTVNFMQRRGTLDDPAYYLHCAKFLRVFLQIDANLRQVSTYESQLMRISAVVICAPYNGSNRANTCNIRCQKALTRLPQSGTMYVTLVQEHISSNVRFRKVRW